MLLPCSCIVFVTGQCRESFRWVVPTVTPGYREYIHRDPHPVTIQDLTLPRS